MNTVPVITEDMDIRDMQNILCNGNFELVTDESGNETSFVFGTSTNNEDIVFDMQKKAGINTESFLENIDFSLELYNDSTPLSVYNETELISQDKNIHQDNLDNGSDLVAKESTIHNDVRKCFENRPPYKAIGIGIKDLLNPKYVSTNTIDYIDIVAEDEMDQNIKEELPVNVKQKRLKIKKELIPKKRLYNHERYDNPIKERKRMNAINAKKNRDKHNEVINKTSIEYEQLKVKYEKLENENRCMELMLACEKKDNTILKLKMELLKSKFPKFPEQVNTQ